MEKLKKVNDEVPIDSDSKNIIESANPPIQTGGQVIAKNVSKFLFKATRKVGYVAYDLATDVMLDNAKKMQRMSGIQISQRLSDLSDEELIRRGQNAKSSEEKNAILKELSERRDTSKSNSHANIENYGKTRVWEYVGKYVAEDKNVFIVIHKCTDVIMEFIIAVVNPPKRITDCTGKFLGKKRVLYSGNGCTIMIRWNNVDDFILKGKVPWEKEEVELHFIRTDHLEL